MRLLIKLIDANNSIKIWNITKDNAIVQEFRDGNKSKKATAKIKYYNDKAYITCKGRRHYLDDFTCVEL